MDKLGVLKASVEHVYLSKVKSDYIITETEIVKRFNYEKTVFTFETDFV